ncbi:MAG TPA: multiheme c-type cytochrome [Candidatus Hypogeohydataceae bacterium YC41]
MRWKISFLALSVVLLGFLIVWGIMEMKPEWKRYQTAEYAQSIESLKHELERWSDPKWGDPKTAQSIEKRIESLKKPRLEVKQILLKGSGLWKDNRNGQRVDRCITCHVDEDKLTKLHPNIAENFPSGIYGCTVCHGGEGESLKLKKAHHGLFRDRKEMLARIKTADALLQLWKGLAELTPEEGARASDFKYYGVTGEKAVYVGSAACLRCHKGLTPFHVDRWKNNKFITMEKVKKALDFINGDEKYRRECYKCHTTGYDEKTGKYVEEGVTCEACHGPGQFYIYFMSSGKVAEASRLSKLGFSYDVCGHCHMARNHEIRGPYMAMLESDEKGQPNAEVAGMIKTSPAQPIKPNEELPTEINDLHDIEKGVALAGTVNSIARESSKESRVQ